MRYVDEERELFGREPKPQGQWVYFLGISPADVVVECGRNGEGGNVWYYFADEMGNPWMKAAPTLDAYVAAHADLAEAGLVIVEPNWGRSGFTIDYLPSPVGLAYDSPAGLAILERHQVTLPQQLRCELAPKLELWPGPIPGALAERRAPCAEVRPLPRRIARPLI